MAGGVHGLISGGSTGEAYAQSLDERLDNARFTLDRLKGRLPLMMGTGAMRTPDSVALAAGAQEMGCDALLIATPPCSILTERENALAVERAGGLPTMLKN